MKKVLALAVVALMLGSCATIVNGPRQQIGISSSPSGAEVTIDDENRGTTPLTVQLSRRKSHTVKVEAEGYETYEAIITSKMSAWVLGNLLFGGLGIIPGFLIDAATGSMHRLTPDQIKADLKKGGTTQR